MNKVLIIISCIGVFISGLLAYMSVWENIDFMNNPEIYFQVYHFGENSFMWKHRNEFTFIASNFISFLISSVYLIGTCMFLFKYRKNRILRNFLLLLEISFVLKTAYWYYRWYLIGFDHFQIWPSYFTRLNRNKFSLIIASES